MLFGDYLCELARRGRRPARNLARRGGGSRPPTTAASGSGSPTAGRWPPTPSVLALGNLRPATPRQLDPAALGAALCRRSLVGGFGDGSGRGRHRPPGRHRPDRDRRGADARRARLSRAGSSPCRAAASPRAPASQREPVSAPPTEFPGDCVTLLRRVRRRAGEIGWREAVHELRTVTQRSVGRRCRSTERRRFIRHLRPWWDVHRHRIAPAVAERIETMQARGPAGHRRRPDPVSAAPTATAPSSPGVRAAREASEQLRVRADRQLLGARARHRPCRRPAAGFARRRRTDPTRIRCRLGDRRRSREPRARCRRQARRHAVRDRPDDPRCLLGEHRRLRHRDPGPRPSRGAIAPDRRT